jgi:hypothetical protein
LGALSFPVSGKHPINRIRQRGINDGAIWYNALQIQHQTRFHGGVNLLTIYTLSKQVEQRGFIDQINRIPQRGLYDRDYPHRFTLPGVWQLPFGQVAGGVRALGRW